MGWKRISHTFIFREIKVTIVKHRMVAGGGKVLIADLPSSDGQALADELGENAIFHPTDVRSSDDINAGVKIAREKFGEINALVNCAGIGVAMKTLGKDGSPH